MVKKMRKTIGILLGIIMVVFMMFAVVDGFTIKMAKQLIEPGNVQAMEAKEGQDLLNKEAKDIFTKTYPNYKISNFKPAPVTGLYELEGGGNVVYFDPKTGMLLFGDILDKTGHNLTQERRNELAAKKVAELPLDKAVKIGSGKIKVVLFTDPDCPYCRQVSNYFKTASGITQYVFFYPLSQIHPNSESKAKYILSQKDPGKAYGDVMSGMLDKDDVKTIKYDERGAYRLEEHKMLAAKAGVNGTPAMWIDGKYVAGANMPVIESLTKTIP